jgi:hypothetical protein
VDRQLPEEESAAARLLLLNATLSLRGSAGAGQARAWRLFCLPPSFEFMSRVTFYLLALLKLVRAFARVVPSSRAAEEGTLVRPADRIVFRRSFPKTTIRAAISTPCVPIRSTNRALSGACGRHFARRFASHINESTSEIMRSQDSGRSGRRSGRGSRRSSSRPRAETRTVHTPPKKQGFWQKVIGFFKSNTKRTNGTHASGKTVTERTGTPRPGRKPEMVEVTSPKLYVGNLAFEATESDLFELFSGVGSVKNAEIVTHKYNEKSKGFGFVLMQTVEEAKRAVSELHDKEFLGRKLVVSGAKSTEREANYRG